jgi:hypothetical protein
MAIYDDILSAMKYIGGMSPKAVTQAKADLASGRYANTEVLQGELSSNPSGIIRNLVKLGKNGKGIAGMKGVLRTEATQVPVKGTGGNMAELEMPRVVDLSQMVNSKAGPKKLNDILRTMQQKAGGKNGDVQLNNIVDFLSQLGTKGLE